LFNVLTFFFSRLAPDAKKIKEGDAVEEAQLQPCCRKFYQQIVMENFFGPWPGKLLN